MAYCESADLEEVDGMCQELLKHVKALDASFLKRPKFHLLLHLSDSMKEFGPTAAYNTERWICHFIIIQWFLLHVCISLDVRHLIG